MEYGSAVQDLEKVGEVVLIPIERIRLYPNQPRKHFSEESLRELAASIKANGQKIPAVVRPVTDDELPVEYELIGGERRYRACKIGDIPFLQCVIREVADEKAQYLDAFTDNAGREPLNDIENIDAVRRMKVEFGMSAEEIAKCCCQGVGWVYHRLRIAELIHPEVIALMDESRPNNQRLTFSATFLMVNLPHEDQLELAQLITTKELRWTQARQLIESRIATHGIHFRSEANAPRKKLAKLHRFLDFSVRELDTLVDRSVNYYTEVFVDKPPAERRDAIQKLKKIRAKAEILQGMLENLTLNT